MGQAVLSFSYNVRAHQDIDELNRWSHRFESPNVEREFILLHYRKPVGLEKTLYLAATQIVGCAGVALHLNSNRVSLELKNTGIQIDTNN